MEPIRSTKQFLEKLAMEKEVLVIDEPVDPNLELAEIQRQVVSRKGPALLFTKVLGTEFPVATNLYGSRKRIDIAFSGNPEKFFKSVATLPQKIVPPNFKKVWQERETFLKALRIGTKNKAHAPVLENTVHPVDLFKLPCIKSWPKDGGAFITLPLVYTENPLKGSANLGMYRIQFHDENTTGMHIQIHRGGGFHYYEAEKLNKNLPAHIYVGGPPALTLAAIAPLPEEVSELLFASALLGEKLHKTINLDLSPLPILADSDFVLIGEIPSQTRMPEGPFGDHYGYYAKKHPYPIFQVKKIQHRKDAIWPATIVGRPPQEDHYIAEYLQELLSPFFPLVMPKVKSIWAYEESGVHSLAAAIVKDRYHKEAFTAALRILGEGHLSLTKALFVTDVEMDLKNFREVFIKVLERLDLKSSLHILNHISQDTLDYTGPDVNSGSKLILIGTGSVKNKLQDTYSGKFSSQLFRNPSVFCPGALAVSGPQWKKGDQMPQKLLKEKSIEKFQFVFLLDSAQDAVKSSEDFIWHVFTRFEPAGDIYGNFEVVRNHLSFYSPIVIDCRMKSWYPEVLQSDPKIEKRVQERFGKIFETL